MGLPNTTLYICQNVPLTNKYDHTRTFADEAEQETYFMSKVVRTFNDYAYLRKNWNIKIEASFDSARKWSYLFFKNGNENKYYYYFITNHQYVNDNVIELSLELDVIQTYYFDWLVRPCFVEREHSKTDEIGANTVDEGLNVGEYVVDTVESVDMGPTSVLFMSTKDLNTIMMSSPDKEVYSAFVGGIFNGLIIHHVSTEGSYSRTIHDIARNATAADSIVSMWHYPTKLIADNNGLYENAYAPYVEGEKAFSHETRRPSNTLDGYTPRNNKLYQYPYTLMYASNNNGMQAVYKYEYFKNGVKFRIQGNISPDAVVRMIPKNYNGAEFNYDEAITLPNFPACSWDSDTYKLWVAQNQNQNNLAGLMGVVKIVGGIGTAIATSWTGMGTVAGLSVAGSGMADIAGLMAQREDKEVTPPQAKGSFTSAHNFTHGQHTFYIYHKTIDKYHARIIDDYFSMFGYACHKVKKPNFTSRPNWNYIKTRGSNITAGKADIPHDDLSAINSIFDKGITFWHTDQIGDYELLNSPTE